MGPLGVVLAGVLATALGVEPPAAAVPPAAACDAAQTELPAVPRDAHDTETLKPIGPRPHPYLAALEITLAVAGAAIWYHRDLQFNAPDFDYNWSLHTWHEKLVTFQAVRFDDNRFDTNVFWHPFDGTWIYLFARGNRLSPGVSLLITTFVATFWEFVVEYREVAAINDMIFTPVAGIALGEPMIRTAALLREGDLGPVGRGLAAVLDPVGAFNGLFEGGHKRGGEETDEHGLPLRYPHRLEMGAGVGYAGFGPGQTRDEEQLGADFFVDATPDLGAPGHRADTVGIGTVTGMTGGGAFGDGQVVGINLDTLVSLVGRQTRTAEGIDDMFVTRARRFYWGLGSGFEYYSRTRPGMSTDLIGTAKLLGPIVNWDFEENDLRLHVLATASYDFALVNSLGLDGYAALYGFDALPHVLSQKRYYYAQGLSTSLRAIAEYRAWELGTSLRDDEFWWIHGRNRIEPQLPEPSGGDRRSMARLWVGVRPWRPLPFKLTVVGEGTVRSGWLGPSSQTISERRISTILGVIF
jgi:hypothetical protein